MAKFLIISLVLLSASVKASPFDTAEKYRTTGNHEKAIEYYQLSEGHPVAAHWLGTYYYDGVVVEQSFVKAVSYFETAAKLGVNGSMVYLANMYLSGNGLNKNCQQARYWVNKFSNNAPSASWLELLQACK